jgi:Tol biopolymer transport system component
MCVDLEGTSSLAAKPKRKDTGGVTKSTFCIALAVLVLLVPFGEYGEGTGKGRVPGAHGATGAIAFTLGEEDCPHNGSKRPCYSRSNIWQVSSDGSGAKPLTGINGFHCGSGWPVWSPDGTRIAFSSNCTHQDIPPKATFQEAVTAYNIWVMNADGSEPKPLTTFADPVSARGAVWSPDGRNIGFISNALLDWAQPTLTGDGDNVWVMNADGKGASRLTHITRGNIETDCLAWSPDGRKLAFISNRALDGSGALNAHEIQNLWIMNADGSGLKPLTKLTAENTYVESIAWSPDSRKLAFSWHRALDSTDAVGPVSPSNIWIANADGSGLKPLTRITDKFVSAFEPDWYPDGSRLIFVSKGNVWVMNADGSGTKPLTNLPSGVKHADAVSSPVWSPDGTKIAFNYTDFAEPTDNGQITMPNIWVVDADGSGAAPVTHWQSGGVSSRLAWRPAQ